jgi:hypothetical protein
MGPVVFQPLATVAYKMILKCRPPAIKGTYCAAEAVFCYTAENSHHLEAQVTSKNPQFLEEKISVRRKARGHVTSEKSSKNYISLCEGKPATGLPTPSPHPSANRYRTFYTWWTASAIRKCKIYSRDLLAGEGGRVG